MAPPHSQTIYIKLIWISASSLACSSNLIAHSHESQEVGKELQILSKTLRGLQLSLLYSPRKSMHSTPASVFLHCSFSHILFLNNTFLSHEHILLFQYLSCQIYFLMQRKTTSKLSALAHTACISLNAKAFAVFLTFFPTLILPYSHPSLSCINLASLKASFLLLFDIINVKANSTSVE